MLDRANHPLRSRLTRLSSKPGVYQYIDADDVVLYVGKAKNIKKRVRSYFTPSSSLEHSKLLMLSKAVKLKTIVTDNELEALLLESTLIKKYRPRYNVLLKDDKSYQYIKIERSDDFPKIMTVRRVTDKKSLYFGPYTNAFAVRNTLKLIRGFFPYRDCNLVIHEKNVARKKYRACLKYHIKTCVAPCIGKVSKDEYEKLIQKCVGLLEGKNQEIVSELKLEMKLASEAREFEKAAKLRDQITGITEITKKQQVVSPKNINEDFISVFKHKRTFIVSLLRVRDGKLVSQENTQVSAPQDTPKSDIITQFMLNYYQHGVSLPKTVVTESPVGFSEDDFVSILKRRGFSNIEASRVSVTTPRHGRRKTLINLGITNAEEFYTEMGSAEGISVEPLHELKDALQLPTLPQRIECFDISNIQGNYSVGSMSVFVNGIPDTSEYRKFKIKTVEGPNDFASMQEVLERRLAQTYEKKAWPKPDLLVIDGGKGQLNAALEIARKYDPELSIISLAKRYEEVFIPERKEPLVFSLDSNILKMLQNVRDEAHRFAISYHRNVRQKQSYKSKLDSIPGVGPKTKKKLLKKFGSVSGIREASEKDIAEATNKKLAKVIKEAL